MTTNPYIAPVLVCRAHGATQCQPCDHWQHDPEIRDVVRDFDGVRETLVVSDRRAPDDEIIVREAGEWPCVSRAFLASGTGCYRVNPSQIRALSPEAREWFRRTLANVRASNARIAARASVAEIRDLNPTVAAREARLRQWANGWRRVQADAPAPVKPAKRTTTRKARKPVRRPFNPRACLILKHAIGTPCVLPVRLSRT